MTLADMSALCWWDVRCRHVEMRVNTTDRCLLGQHVADMSLTCQQHDQKKVRASPWFHVDGRGKGNGDGECVCFWPPVMDGVL
jgi:hypothetical protein